MTAAREIDLGVLSVGERARMEPQSHQQLRRQIEDQIGEAEIMRAHFEKQLRSYITQPPPWEYVQQFADWSARYALAKDRLDRFGFGR